MKPIIGGIYLYPEKV